MKTAEQSIVGSPTKALTLLFLFFVFLLSDFYYEPFGRPFDYAALALLVAIYALNFREFNIRGIFRKSGALFFLISPWILFGAAFNQSILAAGAFLLGITLVMPFSFHLARHALRLHVESQINFLIATSSIVLLVQAALFYLTGSFVDITSAFGSIEARGWNESLGYFRPSGLFQEPNAYCTVMFCLLSLCSFFKNRKYGIEFLGLFSIATTQSLWGMASIFVLIYMLYGMKWLFVYCGILGVSLYLALYLWDRNLNDLADMSITFSRLIYLQDDPSRQQRLGLIENYQLSFPLLFGHGIDSRGFQIYGANGVAFIVYCFGMLGSVVLALYFSYLARMKPRFFLAAAFLLTTFPPFSYMFFWCWLGLILLFCQSTRGDFVGTIKSHHQLRYG